MTTATEKREKLERCKVIIGQLGRGISGTLCYIGADPRSIVGHDCYDKPDTGEDKGDSRIDDETGLVAGGGNCWVRFQVNGKRGERWLMTIALEWRDVYTVWLQGVGRSGKVLWTERMEDVYCDMLKEIVENLYDRALRQRNGGWVNLG